MATFTPEDVVAAYQRAGRKACRYYHDLVHIGDTMEPHDVKQSCCALGVLGAGLPCDPRESIMQTLETTLGLKGSFVFTKGFDLPPEKDDPWRDEPDFKLGRACRQAVEAAGLWTGPR